MSLVPVIFKNLGSYSTKLLKRSQKKLLISKNISTSFILWKSVSFNLSDIGEGIKEVVLKEWFVKAGDKVSQFDNICEVQSDKASVTITSRYDGVITKLHYDIDQTALVGKPLIDLETDSDPEEPTASVSETIQPEPNKLVDEDKIQAAFSTQSKEVEQEEFRTEETPTPVLCIPSVRHIAKKNNIDLSKIKGTGKGGRILKEDVLKYLENPGSTTQGLRISSTPNNVTVSSTASSIEPIKAFKKAMVKTMTEALKIPHFVYSDEIKVTKLSALRRELKNIPDLQTKITSLPFFIKAMSNAISRYPIVNSSMDDKCENIIYNQSHNVGVAMDTSAGLAVPVIKNVQNLTVVQIAEELQRLMSSGKDGTFAPSDLTGGTIALSNIGIIGGTYTKPVILPPQVAILAIGKSQMLPRFDQSGNVVPEEILNVSASADHRVIDGVTMAKFVSTMKRQLENPYLLFLNL